MKNQRKHNNGFTLVELIAVMAIIAITLTFAIPSVFTFNDENEKAQVDAETSAIYKVVSSKAVSSIGSDVTKIFNLTTNKNFFELQNISDDEILFCFSQNVDSTNITTIKNITTIDTTSNKKISELQTENPKKFIIIIPITDTTSKTYDFTQDIVILQPGSDIKYVNGLKDLS